MSPIARGLYVKGGPRLTLDTPFPTSRNDVGLSPGPLGFTPNVSAFALVSVKLRDLGTRVNRPLRWQLGITPVS